MDADTLKAAVARELERVSDVRVLAQIRSLLVEPVPVLRRWSYGEAEQRHPCWSVLDHTPSHTGIAYCESGFGPRLPWGLVWLPGNGHDLWMGDDSGWFPKFLDAYFESRAVADLNIWRVFEGSPGDTRRALSEEASSEATWKRIDELRKANPEVRYYCWHSIAY